MTYNFDKPVDRKAYSSEKWDKYKGKDILPMWIADSEFETAPAIIEALQERVSHGVFGYTTQPTQAVKDAIQHHLSSQYNWDIDQDWIVGIPTLVRGLSLSCAVTGKKGDSVLTPQTIYPPFKFVIQNEKRNVTDVKMRLNNDRLTLDLDALEKAITPDTKTLLFCNPQNPGGAVYTQEELKQLLNICKRHDLVICSDEIHCDLILDADKKHIPLATLSDDAKNRSITLMAASKTFNVAGLGFGFAIIPNEDLRVRYKKLIRETTPDVNLLGMTATAAAFTQCEDWRLEQIEYLRENRDYLMKEINSIEGLKMYPLEATFLAWIDVSGLNIDNPLSFFEDAGVGISAGNTFGNNDFVRLNFACPKSLLEEVVGRIKIALNKKAS